MESWNNLAVYEQIDERWHWDKNRKLEQVCQNLNVAKMEEENCRERTVSWGEWRHLVDEHG